MRYFNEITNLVFPVDGQLFAFHPRHTKLDKNLTNSFLPNDVIVVVVMTS